MSSNKEEIENFDKYAHEWWNKRGPYKLLHNLTPVRVEYIKEYTDFKNKKILDIGCGGGLLSEVMAEAGGDVTGIDASKETIKIAKNHAKEKKLKIDYKKNTLEEFIKTNKQKYDFVICFEMIEHVSNQDNLIKNLLKVCKKDSKVFFSTINRNVLSFIFAKIIAEYVLHLVPKNTHTYEKFIKPSELNMLLENNGFKTIDITGVKFNPLSQSFKLSSFTEINYFLSAELNKREN